MDKKGKLLNGMASFLRERRHELGMSTQDLANMAKVTRSTVQKVESGTHDPKIYTLYRILKALHVGLDWRVNDNIKVYNVAELCEQLGMPRHKVYHLRKTKKILDKKKYSQHEVEKIKKQLNII